MFKRLLLALDFDDAGTLVTAKARQLAEQTGAELHVIHAIEPIPAYAYPGFPGFAEIEAKIKDHAQAELDDIAQNLGIPANCRHLEIGATKNEILRLAEKLKIDCIICGSHSRHGIELLLGSTANAIVHGALCDVLVVRLPDAS